MVLTEYEESLLRGDFGKMAQKLMEISLKVSEFNGARRLIPIRSVHAGGIGGYREGVGGFGTIGIEILEELADNGIKFKVPFTTNMLGMDLREWRTMGMPEGFVDTQMRVVHAYKKLGAIPSFSCLPYMEENVPKFGDHVAWIETGTVAMVNTYTGARSNRESELTGLAAAITGRTGEYGFHLKKNRRGDYLIKTDTELDYADLGALGFCAGMSGAMVPVFAGLRPDLDIDEIQQLVGGLLSGPIALAHIVGVTPEASTLSAAFGGRKPKGEMTFARKDLDEAYGKLCTTRSRDVDFVVIGCHFCTLDKVRRVAKLLDNKRVHENVTLWIQTSSLVRYLAERDGDAQIIEKAGGRLYCDSCALVTSIKKYYGFKVMATDSAKMATVVQGTPYVGVDTLYGSTEKCIQAAINGRWD